MNKTTYFPLASFSEKLETFWCKDSAGGRNWHGKIHHKQLESGWVISNWKKVCIKETAWQPQEHTMLLTFAWNINTPNKERKKICKRQIRNSKNVMQMRRGSCCTLIYKHHFYSIRCTKEKNPCAMTAVSVSNAHGQGPADHRCQLWHPASIST